MADHDSSWGLQVEREKQLDALKRLRLSEGATARRFELHGEDLMAHWHITDGMEANELLNGLVSQLPKRHAEVLRVMFGFAFQGKGLEDRRRSYAEAIHSSPSSVKRAETEALGALMDMLNPVDNIEPAKDESTQLVPFTSDAIPSKTGTLGVITMVENSNVKVGLQLDDMTIIRVDLSAGEEWMHVRIVDKSDNASGEFHIKLDEEGILVGYENIKAPPVYAHIDWFGLEDERVPSKVIVDFHDWVVSGYPSTVIASDMPLFMIGAMYILHPKPQEWRFKLTRAS